jgi:H+/Cl- antiporter ClcA
MRNATVLVLLFGGMAAVLLSFLLPALLTPENTWSTSSADELQKAQQRIQSLAEQLGKAQSENAKNAIKKQLAEVQTKVDGLQSGLEGTINRPYWLSIVVLAIGVIMVGAGWGTYYFAPMPKEKKKTLAELDPDGTLAGKEVNALDYTKAIRASRSKH